MLDIITNIIILLIQKISSILFLTDGHSLSKFSFFMVQDGGEGADGAGVQVGGQGGGVSPLYIRLK